MYSSSPQVVEGASFGENSGSGRKQRVDLWSVFFRSKKRVSLACFFTWVKLGHVLGKGEKVIRKEGSTPLMVLVSSY